MAVSEDYKTHLFSYGFEGQQYGFEIPAKNAKEAKDRLNALAWAKYDGVLVARIPAQFGFVARLAVAVRHTTTALFGQPDRIQ